MFTVLLIEVDPIRTERFLCNMRIKIQQFVVLISDKIKSGVWSAAYRPHTLLYLKTVLKSLVD